MHMPNKPKPYTITEGDESLLLALNRYHYLTAGQLSRLHHPNNHDENRYAQRRLRRLADKCLCTSPESSSEAAFRQCPTRVYACSQGSVVRSGAWPIC